MLRPVRPDGQVGNPELGGERRRPRPCMASELVRPSFGRLYFQAMQIRNIAIIAHVDHGKTTLVDKMLRQAGAFRENQVVAERVMDSNPLERERGITILAKNTSIRWKDTKINIVDTPGHADFGGEVERILRMVDGVLLVVDAFDGPMPQTRFVLRKALELGRTPIVVINKIDRPGADPMRVHDEVLDLFIELEADEAQLDAPVVYASAREGVATMDMDVTPVDLTPLFDTIVEARAAAAERCRRRRSRCSSRRSTSRRISGGWASAASSAGRVTVGDQVAAAADGSDQKNEQARVTKLYVYDGLERIEVQSAPAGEIVSLAGLEGVEIGLTRHRSSSIRSASRASPSRSRRSPSTSSSTIRPSPARRGSSSRRASCASACTRSSSATSRCASRTPSRPTRGPCRGRGELHLTILIETMRREGYEFQVSRPRVITRTGLQRREAGAVRGAGDRRARGLPRRRDREARPASRRDDRDEEPGAGAACACCTGSRRADCSATARSS